jgi:hypothetical protein
VIVATLLLAIAAAGATSLVSTSLRSLSQAQDSWRNEHLLSVAAEHYLLSGPNVSLPDGILPEGYQVQCSLMASPVPAGEDPELYAQPVNGWIVGRYQITLSRDGQAIDTLNVDKLVPEGEL